MKKLINKWHELYKHNLLSVVVWSKQDMGKRDNAMVMRLFKSSFITSSIITACLALLCRDSTGCAVKE